MDRGTRQWRQISVGLAALVVLVSACAPAPVGTVATDTPSSISTKPADLPVTDTSKIGDETVLLAEDELEQAVAQLMLQYSFPVPPPPAGTIEWFEWGQWCMGQLGFVVEIMGGVDQDPTFYAENITQLDQHNAVQNACLWSVVDAGYFVAPPSSEEEVRRLYRAYVKVQECLVENELPTAPAPSEDQFVDSWFSGTGEIWHPYVGGSISVVPGAEIRAETREQLQLQETCPADPGTIFR